MSGWATSLADSDKIYAFTATPGSQAERKHCCEVNGIKAIVSLPIQKGKPVKENVLFMQTKEQSRNALLCAIEQTLQNNRIPIIMPRHARESAEIKKLLVDTISLETSKKYYPLLCSYITEIDDQIIELNGHQKDDEVKSELKRIYNNNDCKIIGIVGQQVARGIDVDNLYNELNTIQLQLQDRSTQKQASYRTRRRGKDSKAYIIVDTSSPENKFHMLPPQTQTQLLSKTKDLFLYNNKSPEDTLEDLSYDMEEVRINAGYDDILENNSNDFLYESALHYMKEKIVQSLFNDPSTTTISNALKDKDKCLPSYTLEQKLSEFEEEISEFLTDIIQKDSFATDFNIFLKSGGNDQSPDLSLEGQRWAEAMNRSIAEKTTDVVRDMTIILGKSSKDKIVPVVPNQINIRADDPLDNPAIISPNTLATDIVNSMNQTAGVITLTEKPASIEEKEKLKEIFSTFIGNTNNSHQMFLHHAHTITSIPHFKCLCMAIDNLKKIITTLYPLHTTSPMYQTYLDNTNNVLQYSEQVMQDFVHSVHNPLDELNLNDTTDAQDISITSRRAEQIITDFTMISQEIISILIRETELLQDIRQHIPDHLASFNNISGSGMEYLINSKYYNSNIMAINAPDTTFSPIYTIDSTTDPDRYVIPNPIKIDLNTKIQFVKSHASSPAHQIQQQTGSHALFALNKWLVSKSTPYSQYNTTTTTLQSNLPVDRFGFIGSSAEISLDRTALTDPLIYAPDKLYPASTSTDPQDIMSQDLIDDGHPIAPLQSQYPLDPPFSIYTTPNSPDNHMSQGVGATPTTSQNNQNWHCRWQPPPDSPYI